MVLPSMKICFNKPRKINYVQKLVFLKMRALCPLPSNLGWLAHWLCIGLPFRDSEAGTHNSSCYCFSRYLFPMEAGNREPGVLWNHFLGCVPEPHQQSYKTMPQNVALTTPSHFHIWQWNVQADPWVRQRGILNTGYVEPVHLRLVQNRWIC